MAEPLKNHFDRRVPQELAKAIGAVWPAFRTTAFLERVSDGYDALELMDRGRHIARVLRGFLPGSFPDALEIVLRSAEVPRSRSAVSGAMASFYFLPHVCFIAEFGLDHFDESMHGQYLLTQRFTAEFSIRPFIDRYQAESLALLRKWADDPNVHVRRLVSEGTRPRLPWAGRLRAFQKDPTPVLALLEVLKDDSELYVRRSVANNLNDIGRDHPDVLVALARRWMKDASADRQALVRHALRSLVKQGHAGALTVLGFGGDANVALEDIAIAPRRVAIGGNVAIAFSVRSAARRRQRLLVDFCVHFVKANGRSSPKVFKLKTADLAPGETVRFRKTVSLAALTTRQPHKGTHRVEALINGRVEPLGAFVVV